MSDSTGDKEGPPLGPGPIGERVESALARLMDGVGAEDVFGEPHQVGERVILTASVIERTGGFGFGGGFGFENGEGEESRGGGGGGGGGGTVVGRPIAVIDVGPEGVTVKPVLDATKIGITIVTSVLAAIGVVRGVRRLSRGGV